jgi:hypothetical protein
MRQVVRSALVGTVGLLGMSVMAADGVPLASQQTARPASSAPSEPLRLMERMEPISSARTGPIAIGVDADVYCAGWLGGLNENFVGSIVSAEKVDTQKAYGPLDIVYIDIGKNRGAENGQEFWVCRPDVLVSKAGAPEQTIGRIYRTPARVRITCAQEVSSIAEIVGSCDGAEIGDVLLPFEPVPIPLVRRTRLVTQCDTPNGKATGHLVHAFDSVTGISQHSIVFLDLGERDGVAPGDFLTVYRTRESAGALRTLLGEAAILMTRARSSVAKIMVSKDAMVVGDEVELK